MKQIKIGEKFQNKEECFSFLRPCIKAETLDFLSKNTRQVQLNQLQENIYAYIIEKDATPEENNGIIEMWEEGETLWLRDLTQIEDFGTYDTNVFYTVDYVLLFCEAEEQCRFLGLYQQIYDGFEYQRWKRIEESSIPLDKEILEKQIEKNKYEWANEQEKQKRYEDLCWIAIRRTGGEACKFIEKELLSHKSFAQKVLQTYGTAIQYFPEEIRKDTKMYQNMGDLGNAYPYAPLSVRQKKEIAIRAIQEMPYNFQNMAPELKEDKDIVATYEKAIQQMREKKTPIEKLCSIIGIDEFGNQVIDQWLQSEKTKHFREEIDEDSIAMIQWIKSKQEKTILDYPVTVLDQEIFEPEQQPIIVLIGEKENEISKQIKEKYEKSIEIYTKDGKDSYLKMITTDQEKIQDLLRIILFNKDNYQFHSILKKECIFGNQIEIQKMTGTMQEIQEQIENMPRCERAEMHFIQIVHSKWINLDSIGQLEDIIRNGKKNRYIEEIVEDNSGIYGIEILILKAYLKV